MKKIQTLSIIFASFCALIPVSGVFGGEISSQERLSENGQVNAATHDSAGGTAETMSSQPTVVDKHDESAINSFSASSSSNNENKTARFTKTDDGVGERK